MLAITNINDIDNIIYDYLHHNDNMIKHNRKMMGEDFS